VANSKAIGVIAVGIVIVAIVVAYASNQDQVDVSNKIPMETAQDSSVSISDSASLTQNNPDYEVDEEGNKKYIISAKDSPTLGD